MSENSPISSRSIPHVRIMVADRNLMSAQLLAQVLARDARFQVTIVSKTTQMTAAGDRVDVAVLSSDLSGGIDETLRLMSRFSERHPRVRLILLVDAPSRDRVVDAFRCGASGVFSRALPIEDFFKCVDRVSNGEIWATRSEIDHLLSALRSTPISRMMGCGSITSLSKRELEVVRHASEGLANKEIAEKLGLSEHTVKNYLFRAFDKLGVSNRIELLFFLLRQEKSPGWQEFSGENGLPSTYEKAAEDGFVAAQFALGMAHHRGDEAEKNDVFAYYWLTLAERNAEHFRLESKRALEELKETMSPAAIQQAKERLENKTPEAPGTRNVLTLLKNKNAVVSPQVAV